MSIIQVQHIHKNCQSRFGSLIDMSDVITTNAGDREDKLLSRSLAAFAIAAVAKTDDVTAAQAVVDEFHDDGIDAFYFNRTEHIAYLVQSKWIKDGNGAPNLGSILKFTQGINHFLEDNGSQLGAKMQAKAADVQDALSDSQATFVLVVAYTGKQPLAVDVATPLNQLVNELNDDGDLVTLQVLKQKELHDIVEAGALGASVDMTVMLHEFGKVDTPYTAYYGHAHITDLATWGIYGDRLYHKNIRGFKGSTDVNDSIVEAIKTSPQHFLYFNNGITLLCAEIDKKPLGGRSKTSGVFDCKGASVIKPAQTVGSILTALKARPADPAIGTDGRVMIRLISLENCPPDFANEVTRAANTQNRIEKRDFAALDKEQNRLRSEMLLSLGKEYVYRTGDQPPSTDKGCTLEEATVALACVQPDLTHAVNAKQAIGRFYDDTTKAPYTILFNSSLTAIKLWRAVEILRSVDVFLKEEQKNREGKEKLCAIHGNRVLLHLVFKQLGSAAFDSDNSIAPFLARVPDLTVAYLEKMAKEIETNYSSSYVGNVFKNISKCKAIVAVIAT